MEKNNINLEISELEKDITKSALELKHLGDVKWKKREGNTNLQVHEKRFLESNDTILDKTNELEEDLEMEMEKESLETQDRILRNSFQSASALENKKESGTLKLEDNNSDSRPNEDDVINKQANEKEFSESKDRILTNTLQSGNILEKRNESEALKLEDRISDSGRNEGEIIKRQVNEKEFSESKKIILIKTVESEDSLERRKTPEVLKSEEWSQVARRSTDIDGAPVVVHSESGIKIQVEGDESLNITLSGSRGGANVVKVEINASQKTDGKTAVRTVFRQEGSPVGSPDVCRIMNTTRISTGINILCDVLMSSVAITLIVIGSMFLGKCPVQPYIPIFLVVLGAFQLFVCFMSICRKIFHGTANDSFRIIACLIKLFMFVWFIMGCVWVYGTKDVEFYDTAKKEYCHNTVYYFAFWFLNSVFMFILAPLALCTCCLCWVVCAEV